MSDDSEGHRMAMDVLDSEGMPPDSLDADPGWWETAEGEVIKIKKMTDRHLLNAIAWMVREGWDDHLKFDELVAERGRRGLR